MRIRLQFLPVFPEVRTAAGHLYSAEALRLVHSQIQAKLPMMGSLSHPLDGRTRILDASHILHAVEITSLQWIGHLELLSSTQGRLVQALFANGISLYLAARLMCNVEDDGRVVEHGLVVANVDIVTPDNMIETAPLDIIVRAIFSPSDDVTKT